MTPARPLDGQRALVTGASRGIGEATARALAEAGALVALAARSADALTSIIADLGDGHLACVADLSTPAGAMAVVAAVNEWAGGAPDILVNNAGVFTPKPIPDQDPDDFADVLRVNLASPFRLVHAFFPTMVRRASGHIVTVGSVSDRRARAANAAYAASKFGLRGLHESLRSEAQGTGVRASLVSPSGVDTPIWQPLEARLGRDYPARTEMLAAEDVASAIVFVVTRPARVNIEELRLSRS